MKRALLFIITLFLTLSIYPERIDFESLYKRLDTVIDNSHNNVARRESRILKIRSKLKRTNDIMIRYHLYFSLFDEYQSYKNDSAIAQLRNCMRIAKEIRKPSLVNDCLCVMALQSSKAGMYTESLTLLKNVKRQELDNKGLCDYYIAYNHTYGELGSYSDLAEVKQTFFDLSKQYRDSLDNVINHNSDIYLMKKENDLINDKNDYKAALKINDQRMASVKEGSHNYAIVSYFRYLIYMKMNNMDMAKYWLIQSAISDIENAIMDQASLWTLADMLSKEGDSERSYKYITYSWYAAQTFGTKVRNWQISPILNAIDTNYQKEIKTRNRELMLSITVVSIMAFMLFLLLVYVNKQKKRLTIARNELKKTNGKLANLNSQLSKINEELDLSNQNLHDSNTKLNESNRVKEAYIGRFIGMCSLYIDKLDSYRKQVNRMMKNKQLDELFNMTKSSELKEKEVDELYANFDSVFLHLFPDFVKDFNSLLREEERIQLVEKEKLTTPLRIFALIRLGIDDSSKIAEFLHYSVNTIYNYRAKIKNGAAGDRNNFEKQVKELGSPRE